MSQAVPGRAPPKRRDWSWRSQAFRGLVYQILAIALVALAVWFLAHNTLENMRVRGIQSGFGFLTQPAGFDIGEPMFNYEALDPYWKAFLVGIGNTLRVAVIGVVLTTILGTLLGDRSLFAQRPGPRACATATSNCSATSRCCCSC